MLVGKKTMLGKETQPSVVKMEAFTVAPKKIPSFLPFWHPWGYDKGDCLSALERENHLKTKIIYYIKEESGKRHSGWKIIYQ